MNSYLIMDDKKTIENFGMFSNYVTEQKRKTEKKIVNEQEKNVRNTIRDYARLIFSRDIIKNINDRIDPQYRIIVWICIILITIIFIYQVISKSINFVINTSANFVYYLIYYILFAIPFWIIRLIVNIFRYVLGFRKKSTV